MIKRVAGNLKEIGRKGLQLTVLESNIKENKKPLKKKLGPDYPAYEYVTQWRYLGGFMVTTLHDMEENRGWSACRNARY